MPANRTSFSRGSSFVLGVVGILWGPVLSATVRADVPAKVIETSLRRIEQGAGNYIKNRQCFSCHHQAMSILSMTSAQRRGFAIEPAKLKQQVEFTLNTFRPKHQQIVKGQGIPGGNTMAAYALCTLEAAGHPADETTTDLVEYLLVRQRPDGAWPALAKRPPTEGSTFTNNALALRGLRVYGPAKDPRVDQAFARGRDWLLKNEPVTTEDKAFRLRGLIAAEVDRKEIDAARDLLLKEQREDGSWAQLSELAGDAYATGTVLMALRAAGMKPTEPAYQKGVKYLLTTQNADGSWLVQTRSRPVQVFFDNGDPGGPSQFISFAATNWAVLALLDTMPMK
jgi:N-acyl-D-amino-acid deacylase